LKRLDCRRNRITREISGIFAEIYDFSYDRRYAYSMDDYGNWLWTDNGVGWWWPGEPYS
jgi:hypothetical protein